MKTILHKADSRGQFNHGWLKTFHTFSFADYYDPSRINFGPLRVINEDLIQGGEGFGMHPHKNMEIITFPLSGTVKHRDSMGNEGHVSFGEIQVMSAGTGIYHSEHNANVDIPLHLLQIWVLTAQQNVQPRYSQFNYLPFLQKNKLLTIVSSNENEPCAWIHQNVAISYGEFDAETQLVYETKKGGNGFYLFVVEGELQIHGLTLSGSDGLGVENTDVHRIKFNSFTRVLVFDMEMN